MEIRAVLFDLGDTLEANGQLMPGAVEALQGISKLEGGSGRLKLGLVSDYTMLPAGTSQDRIEAVFREYVAVVRSLGLLRFFDPPEAHMTISTQAGVQKPHRKIFELALERLGLGTDLTQAIFVTESAEHVQEANRLGMTSLQYGSTSGIPAWSSAVAKIRAIVGRAA